MRRMIEGGVAAAIGWRVSSVVFSPSLFQSTERAVATEQRVVRTLSVAAVASRTRPPPPLPRVVTPSSGDRPHRGGSAPPGDRDGAASIATIRRREESRWWRRGGAGQARERRCLQAPCLAPTDPAWLLARAPSRGACRAATPVE